MNATNDLINCPICFLAYDADVRRPDVINPCGHSICKQCLTHMGQHLCPICRNSIVGTMPNWLVIQNLSQQQKSVNDEFNGLVSSVGEMQSVIMHNFKLLHDEHNELTNRIEQIKEDFRILDKKGLGFVDPNEAREDENKKMQLKNQLSSSLISLRQLSDKLANVYKY